MKLMYKIEARFT